MIRSHVALDLVEHKYGIRPLLAVVRSFLDPGQVGEQAHHWRQDLPALMTYLLVHQAVTLRQLAQLRRLLKFAEAVLGQLPARRDFDSLAALYAFYGGDN